MVVSSYKDEYDCLRERWKSYITGDLSCGTGDPHIKGVVDNGYCRAEELWERMNQSEARNFLWPELESTTESYVLTHSYRNLFVMTQAFSTSGSCLEGNGELLKDIIDGLEWMHSNRYNNKIKHFYKNWWDWEIGTPIYLNNIVVLLYEFLSEDQVKKYMDSIRWFQPDAKKSFFRNPYGWKVSHNTGANRVDTCRIAAVAGIIGKDASMVSSARDALMEVFMYVTSGDGFYEDGSFIQHTDVPYNGTYGNVLLGGIGDLLYLLDGTSWELKQEEISCIYKIIFDSFRPLMYKGIMIDMVNGRAISRGVEDHGHGHEIIRSVIKYTRFAPHPVRDELKGLVRLWIEGDTYKDFFSSTTDVNSILWAKEILNAPSVPYTGEVEGHFGFYNMDRVVHRRPGFTFGISMYSARTKSYEGNVNNENTKGFHTSDGMTYLYDADLGQYSGDFWPTVDSYRLAGTTVDIERLDDGQGGFRSPRTWVGGTSINGLFGIAGMHLDKRRNDGTNPLDMNLQAKKSWFMFDDEIVALGAGISSTDGRNIETIVENRKILDSGSNKLTVDGASKPVKAAWSETMQDVGWIHLEGNVVGADIGYYFPQKTCVKALRESRKGLWHDINKLLRDTGGKKLDITFARNYVTVWFDHGPNPVDTTYSYVILPGKSVGEVEAYTREPDVEILANTPEVQAVREKKLTITGAIFWTDSLQKADMISTAQRSAVMLREWDNTLEVSVADPTMENDGVIHVEIDRKGFAEASHDDQVDVLETEDRIVIEVNVKNARGKSFRVKFVKPEK